MIRLAGCAAVLLLAGCPKQTAGTGPQPATGAGCPSAANVFVASYVTQEQGRSGWVMPLHTTAPAPGDVAGYASIDVAAARGKGVPEAPAATLWLATPNAAPCRATLRGYYAAAVPGPPASVSYGAELDGCPPPANAEQGGGIVLVSEQAPTGCRFEPPQPVAARVGEMDAQKQWQRPTKETPLPKPIADAIPARECKAPDCEMLWAFSEVKVAGKTVAWSGAVNWLAVAAPADPCKWQSERFSGFFVPAGDGPATKITEGQQHSLVLAAVLADDAGAKVLFADGPGEYATYDVAPGKATLGHHVRWELVPDEAWDAVDHLGPICESAP